MRRKSPLKPLSIVNTDPVAPTPTRPVRTRARTLVVDAHFEPHQHPWAQLAYCTSGLIAVTVCNAGLDTTCIVPPSRAVWIAPGAQHAVTVLEAAELRTVYLDPGATPTGWARYRVLRVSALLRELIHALEASQPGPRDEHLMQLVVMEMTAADTQALGVPLPRDKRLRALCEAVLREPTERATLADWARDIGASQRTVARLFRAELGTSYQQWRQQAILAHALPLLARGTPVRQVAEACGYASASAFCAMFKIAMGQLPSDLRTPELTRRQPARW